MAMFFWGRGDGRFSTHARLLSRWENVEMMQQRYAHGELLAIFTRSKKNWPGERVRDAIALDGGRGTRRTLTKKKRLRLGPWVKKEKGRAVA